MADFFGGSGTEPAAGKPQLNLILRDITMPDLEKFEVVRLLHPHAVPALLVAASTAAKGDGLVLSPCAAAYLTESLHPPRPRPPS
jgi:CheY-like chemotaxis protein